jgi:hypothetical protein
VFYGSNPYRKDNPRWAISNATVTPKVPDAALQLLPPVSGPRDHPVTGLGGGIVAYVARAAGDACGIGVSWLIGLPRRAGTRLHAMSDAEALWWRWQVTERWGGLVHQYRDARFEVLRHDSAILREEPRAGLAGQDPAPPDCPCPGDR